MRLTCIPLLSGVRELTFSGKAKGERPDFRGAFYFSSQNTEQDCCFRMEAVGRLQGFRSGRIDAESCPRDLQSICSLHIASPATPHSNHFYMPSNSHGDLTCRMLT